MDAPVTMKGGMGSPQGRAKLNARKPIGARSPLVREVFARLDNLPKSLDFYSEAAGVERTSLSHWRSGNHDPGLTSFAAIVEAIGGRLVIEWGEEA